jgi:16S rRNA (cytidine1402-2'-O)-methyltransferase
VVACEDTRVTRRLLESSGLTAGARLRSLHEHSSDRKVMSLVDELERGLSLALVSDAGTPTCSDPGFELVREVVGRGFPVVSLPGPSAALAALVASGLPTDRFVFAGFLPAKSARRRRSLQDLAGLEATLVLYEAPGRLIALLQDIHEVLGPRRVCVAREISKLHEEYLRGVAAEIREVLAARERVRGEIVVVVEGAVGAPAASDAIDVERLVDLLLGEGVSPRSAKSIVSELTGLPKSQVYELILAKAR